MKTKSLEIFIPGPAGRLEAKYYKNPKFGSPVAIVLHPHPQYGGTMNNRIVQLMYNIFLENGFSVIKVNFRGVGKSDGVFDNGQGELSDAAAALDWIEIAIKLLTSGLLIISCIQMSDPNENPETQH